MKRWIALAAAALIAVSGLPMRASADKISHLTGVYEGPLENNTPNGSGTIIWNDGSYTGNFLNGYPDGSGTLTYSSNQGSASKSGTWGNSFATIPMSTGEAAVGALYFGLVCDNVPWGVGTVQFPYGGYFFGFFVDGVPCGAGTYHRADGTAVDGTFTWCTNWETKLEGPKDGGPEYNGTEMRYSGMLRDGVPCGFGSLDFGVAGTFFGEFDRGAVSGSGIYYSRQSACPPMYGTNWNQVSRVSLENFRWYSGLRLGDVPQGFGMFCQDYSYRVGEVRNGMSNGFCETWYWNGAGEPSGDLRKGDTGIYANGNWIAGEVYLIASLTPVTTNEENIFEPFYYNGFNGQTSGPSFTIGGDDTSGGSFTIGGDTGSGSSGGSFTIGGDTSPGFSIG